MAATIQIVYKMTVSSDWIQHAFASIDSHPIQKWLTSEFVCLRHIIEIKRLKTPIFTDDGIATISVDHYHTCITFFEQLKFLIRRQKINWNHLYVCSLYGSQYWLFVILFDSICTICGQANTRKEKYCSNMVLQL